MPLFFVLSGYIYKDKPKFMLGKAKRLLIPYFAYSAVLYVVFLLFNVLFHWGNSKEVLIRYLIGIFYSRYELFSPVTNSHSIVFLGVWNGPLWFLTVMFVSFALFYILHRLSIRGKILLSLGYIVIAVLLSELPILLPWSLDTAFIGALFIEAGCQLSSSSLEKYSKQKLIVIFFVALIIYCPIVLLNGRVNMSIGQYGTRGIASVYLFTAIGIVGSVIYIVFSLLLESTLYEKIFSFIGNYTITILGTHLLVYRIAESLLPISNSYLQAVVKIPLALLLAVILKTVYKKINVSFLYRYL